MSYQAAPIIHPVVDSYLGDKATQPWTMWFRNLDRLVPAFGDVFGPVASAENTLARFDGLTGRRIKDSTVTLSDDGVFGGTFFDTLRLRDLSGDYYLALSVGETFTANRALVFNLTDADREITLLGNSTLDDWFDQSVKAAASPGFAGLTVNSHAFTVNGAPTLNNWFDQSVKQAASPTFAGVTVNGFVVTVSGAPTLNDWFDQSVKVAASPTFAGLTVNGFALTVGGAPTLNDWFNQSVKSTASPTFAALTVTNNIGAASYSAGLATGADETMVLTRDGGGTWALTFTKGLMTEAVETP